eukprot:2120165-Rhodomonas_salina.1
MFGFGLKSISLSRIPTRLSGHCLFPKYSDTCKFAFFAPLATKGPELRKGLGGALRLRRILLGIPAGSRV